jgi:spermidine/putrescine transport system substrate-binding protein
MEVIMSKKTKKKGKSITRREMLKKTALGLTCIGAGSTVVGGFPGILRASKKEVVVYAWYTPIMTEVIPKFEKDTGIKVKNLGGYSKDSEWFAKVKAGESFDFIIPGSNYAITAIKAGMFNPLDPKRIPNWKNLGAAGSMPEFMKEGKPYVAPWTRVIYAQVYNTEHIRQKPDSWKECWNSAYKGKISMNDRANLQVATACLVLGGDPNNPQDWDGIKKLLMEQKSLVLKYWTDHQAAMEMFARGGAWIGLHTDGRVRRWIRKNAPVNYSIPKEGACSVLDSMAIPITSKNPELGHEFINYMLRPEIGILEMTKLGYLALNEAAVKQLPPEMKSVFELPKDAKLILLKAPPPELSAKMEKLWLEVKMS